MNPTEIIVKMGPVSCSGVRTVDKSAHGGSF
jgi:hypothetical protein